MKPQNKRIAYVAWVNTDLTEGRGFQRPLYVARSRACVERLGKGKNVQGSDAAIIETEIFDLNGVTYGPIYLQHITREDIDIDNARIEREKIIDKARKLGLTEEEIKKIAK